MMLCLTAVQLSKHDPFNWIVPYHGLSHNLMQCTHLWSGVIGAKTGSEEATSHRLSNILWEVMYHWLFFRGHSQCKRALRAIWPSLFDIIRVLSELLWNFISVCSIYLFYFFSIFFISCISSHSGFVVMLLFGKINSEKYLERCEHAFLPPTSAGIPRVSSIYNKHCLFYMPLNSALV